MLFKVPSSSRPESDEKCHTFKGTEASKLNYSNTGLPWKDQTSAGIHRFLTVCLSHRMDLLNHTSSSTEERTSFPLPWSICTRMDLEHPPSNKTLHQQNPESVKWGMNFIGQRPCSHPRHCLILKTLCQLWKSQLSLPPPPTTQGKLIRKLWVDMDLTHLKKCARDTSFLEDWVGLESCRTCLNETRL